MQQQRKYAEKWSMDRYKKSQQFIDIRGPLTLAFKHREATMVKHSLFSVPVLGWWLNAVDMLEMKAMMNLLSGH